MAGDLQQLYQEAITCHEQGRLEQAVELYDRILVVYPTADLVLYNQGLALFELRRYAGAVEILSRAVAIRDDDPDTWFNLAMALKHEQQYDEAQDAYERALQLQPSDLDILYNLANCCRASGALDKAELWYEKLLKLSPSHRNALNNYAYLCHRRGRYPLAEKLYKRLLAVDPDHAAARHMLAALTGSAGDTPDHTYVQDLFDQYSCTFDRDLLDKLEYQVPRSLFDFSRKCCDNSMFSWALDLGCGTGLAGEVFRPVCEHLTGVDLSGKMVEVAHGKEVYDHLVAGDIVQYLLQTTKRYDLFIAADVLTYMGNLSPLFTAISRQCRPGARFVFSTEHGNPHNWVIRSTGRFAHNPEYVRGVIALTGGCLQGVEPVRLRKEAGQWIGGDMYHVVWK